MSNWAFLNMSNITGQQDQIHPLMTHCRPTAVFLMTGDALCLNLQQTHLLALLLGLYFVILSGQKFRQRYSECRIFIKIFLLDPSIPFNSPAYEVHVVMQAIALWTPPTGVFVLLFFILVVLTCIAKRQRQGKSHINFICLWSPHHLSIEGGTE